MTASNIYIFFLFNKHEKVAGLSFEHYTPLLVHTTGFTFLLIRCFMKRATWLPDNDLTVNEQQYAARCAPCIVTGVAGSAARPTSQAHCKRRFNGGIADNVNRRL